MIFCSFHEATRKQKLLQNIDSTLKCCDEEFKKCMSNIRNSIGELNARKLYIENLAPCKLKCFISHERF